MSEQFLHVKWIKQESKENYMRAIYMLGLQKKNGVRYMDLEEYFGFSKASVCKEVRALRDEGLVTIDGTYSIWLTEEGQDIAMKIYDKYSFFRKLLVGAGVELELAEAEANKLEHGISSASLSNLVSIYAGDMTESE